MLREELTTESDRIGVAIVAYSTLKAFGVDTKPFIDKAPDYIKKWLLVLDKDDTLPPTYINY